MSDYYFEKLAETFEAGKGRIKIHENGVDFYDKDNKLQTYITSHGIKSITCIDGVLTIEHKQMAEIIRESEERVKNSWIHRVTKLLLSKVF